MFSKTYFIAFCIYVVYFCFVYFSSERIFFEHTYTVDLANHFCLIFTATLVIRNFNSGNNVSQTLLIYCNFVMLTQIVETQAKLNWLKMFAKFAIFATNNTGLPRPCTANVKFILNRQHTLAGHNFEIIFFS